MSRILSLCVLLACSVLVLGGLVGCSSGANIAARQKISTGTAVFDIYWPTRSRVVPAATENVVIFFSGAENLPAPIRAGRPDIGGDQEVAVPGLPPGKLLYKIIAYSGADTSTTPLGVANGSVDITAGEIATVPVAAGMTSTIANVTIRSEGGLNTMQVGETRQLVATARDAHGYVLIIPESNWSWNAVTPQFGTVTASGLVTGISPGLATFTVNESDSGKSALIEVTVAFNPGTMTDIGILSGSTYCTAYGINSAEQVVGASTDTQYNDRAFIWSPGAGMRALGTLGGSNVAYDINDTGQVVGFLGSTGSEHAFIWTAASGMQDLGNQLGSGASKAMSINSSGQVVGYYTSTSGQKRAFRWTATGGMQDLGTLTGKSDWSYYAVDSNDNGQIVGYVNTPSSQVWRGFYWTVATGMQDIGDLGSRGITPFAINASGQVVGESYYTATNTQGFIWTDGSGMQALTSLGGAWNRATDINDAGQIVGYSTTGAGKTEACMWSPDGSIRDLGNLGGVQGSSAYAINADGIVCGRSYIGVFSNLSTHAFVWTP